MPIARLIQTEKAYNLQQAQVFVISFADAYKPNKIELTKIFQKNDLNPTQVRIVNLPNKTKRKGAKRRSFTTQRPAKYYVKLKVGETLDDEKLAKIFSTTENTQA